MIMKATLVATALAFASPAAAAQRVLPPAAVIAVENVTYRFYCKSFAPPLTQHQNQMVGESLISHGWVSSMQTLVNMHTDKFAQYLDEQSAWNDFCTRYHARIVRKWGSG